MIFRKFKLKERTDTVIAFIVIVLAGVFIYYKIYNKTTIEDSLLAESTITNTIVNLPVNSDKDILNVSAKEITIKSKETTTSPLSSIVSYIPVGEYSNSIKVEKEFNEHKLSTNHFNNETPNKVFQEKIEKQSDEEVVQEVITEEIQEEALYEEVEEVVENTSLTANTNAVNYKEEAINAVETIAEEVIEEVNSTTEVVTNEVEEVIENTTSVKEEVINYSNAEETDCVIVVGAFSQLSNKDNVIDKLTNLGYNYEEGKLRNGLTYVGVPVNCSKRDEINKLTNELDNAFNVIPWIKRK